MTKKQLEQLDKLYGNLRLDLPKPSELSNPSALSTQVGGDHYKNMGKYQPWEIIESLNLDFFEGSVLKYLLRWRKKNGVEDLRKAIHVLERMIEQHEVKK
jgi:hypothetical protein